MPAFEQLLIPGTLWRSSLGQLQSEEKRFAVGTLRRSSGRHPPTLLVRDLQVDRELPTGADYSPLTDWIVVITPRSGLVPNPADPGTLFHPRFSQLLVILLVGVGADLSGWQGWIIERGRCNPLEGFRIVGRGMADIQRPPDSTESVRSERWSRLEQAIGDRAFQKLRRSTVAVVGTSRTGSHAAQMFAAIGVRRLVLIDPDDIEIHNLDSMIGVTEEDIGESKAVALARHLIKFRSDLAVTAVTKSLLTETAIQSLVDADLVVTCVDQDAPRLKAASICRELIVPHLDIGTGVRAVEGTIERAADVRLLLPRQGCVACVGGIRRLAEAEDEIRAPEGSLPTHPPRPWNADGRIGSLTTLNSVAASLGVQSWLDLLAGNTSGSVWHRLRWPIGGTFETQGGQVSGAAGCRRCG